MLSFLSSLLWRYQRFIRIGILSSTLLAFFFAQSYQMALEGAEIAWILLWVILWIPIFSRVFWWRWATGLLGFRKELGIVMGVFSAVHFVYMFPFISLYWNYQPWIVICGVLPQVIILLLTLTSNTLSQRLLGKYWKYLHRLVYVVPPMIFVQIGLAQGFEWIDGVIMVVYYIAKMLEWKGIRLCTPKAQIYPQWQKFLCVPCGYVYDPVVGNPDDGIPVGTEFVDIPDDWRCPDCGVTKADFIPYNEQESIAQAVKILQKTFLNPTVIELILDIPKGIQSHPGQFAAFEYRDEMDTFRRQYSVAKRVENRAIFLIKINAYGRGGKILMEKGVGDTLQFVGFFWDFRLKNTKNPKVFIATGTGLAPIFALITSIPHIPKRLYMSVQTQEDMFYEDILRDIPHLETHLFLSREVRSGFHSGRMDFSHFEAEKHTEFYLCGSTASVEAFEVQLRGAGYTHIYSEKFSA